MTRAKDISKIVTDADLSGTLDVTGEVTTADDIKFTSGARHKFVGGGTGNNLELGTYSSSNTSRDVHLEIDSAGNVGIGTSPSHQLHVQASGNGKVRFEGNLNSNTSDLLISHNTSGDSGFQYNSNQLNMFTYGDIAFYAGTGNISGGYPANERMRIDSSGNVGIGTSSPDTNLDVEGAGDCTISITAGSTSHDSKIDFVHGSTIDGGITYDHNGSYTSEKMAFRAGNNTPHMYLTGSGNVGIGTSSPTANLDIKRTGGDSDDIIRIGTTDNFYLGISRSNTTGAFSFQGNQTGFNNIILAPTSGSVSIGTTDTQPQNGGSAFKVESLSRRSLFMSQSGTGNANIIIFYSGGNLSGAINIASGSVSYGSGSDYRIKENIVDLTDATTRLKQLKPKRFNFITNPDDEARDGFLAHEVSSIVPEAVIGEKDAVDENGEIIVQQLDPSKLVPLLVKTIQELETRIVALENA
jgi:hypothetical protein